MSFQIMGRYDVFLAGMKSQIVSSIGSIDLAKKELINTTDKLSTDFRSVYDSLVPNIHAIDVYSIANAVSNDMATNPDKYFRNSTDFTDPEYTSRYGPINYPKIQRLKDGVESVTTSSFLTVLRANIRERIRNYHAKVIVVAKRDPVEELNTSIEASVKKAILLLDDPTITESQKVDLVFNLGFDTRAQISKIFGSAAILGISSDSNSIKVDSRFLLFFGKSFSAMVTTINQEVNSAVTDTIKASTNASTGNFVPRGSSIGRLIHFGHSAIRQKDKQDITTGIKALFNSPGYLKTAFIAVNSVSGAAPDLGLKYIRKTGHLKHSIIIDKNINSTIGAIMSIGITFTQDQLSLINLAMAPKEGLAGGRGAGKAKLTATISNRQISEYALNRMFPKIAEVVQARSSPSILDLLTDKLISTLSGKPSKYNPKSRSERKGDIAVTSLVAVNNKPKVTRPKIIIHGKPQSDISPKLRTTGGQFTSLVSLQNLLNQGLASQIQKNMGTGDRRDILNYRSGRFAESAKVETMSQSREGMITAFYSYMRNPYATFSFGGAQSSPATRDPKLLISRSIREIGATMVGNRMRAVLV